MTNIRDLAKMAGVSVTTVSRVLNNHPYVSEDKRNAVLKAAEASNYVKNINAVHLSRGKTQLIGVILPYSDLPYFSLLLKGIAKEALEHNYKLVMIQTDYLESREMEALAMLRQKQIDALIFCSRTCDLSMIHEYAAYGPIVLCENRIDEHVSSTYVDHYRIFMEALEYLRQKGHEKIGYCIGRKSGASSRQREMAYREFHKQHNLPLRPSFIIDQCLYFEDGERAASLLSEMKERPTALLVTSDQVAAGLVISCSKFNLRIPEDLAIIGFDNEPISKLMNITTIEIPLVEMGKSLFKQAIQKDISSKELPVTLIERETV